MVLEIIFCVVVGWGVPTNPSPRPHLEFTGTSVRAEGFDSDLIAEMRETSWGAEDWTAVFPVYTKSSFDKGVRQPMAGSYALEKESIVFAPLFPFSGGESYYTLLHYDVLFKRLKRSSPVLHRDDERSIPFTFAIPKKAMPFTLVSKVYPSGDTLPENVLRMHVRFSAAMSTGDAYRHIHLFDDDGTVVEKAFLTVDQELWDADRERFTLLFDPGRIKRGLRSNLDLGAPLNSTRSYRLVIDSGWRDQNGNTLARNYEKKITIGDPARERLATRNWKIVPPKAGSKNELVIEFDKPLDYILALKYIVLTQPLTGIVPGRPELKEGERRWIFVPETAWKPGLYSIEISPLLEDVAGNNFNNPFDLDLNESARVNSEEPLRITFSVNQIN